ncbi:hypothetical protein [Lactobacillus crispatus]|uniref:hypothetical protein n=1 Tax=Lactobacillus crispatus TaxID=47770 RepID=UPI001414DCB2|nr:hypothetical protein [Lactobacillus crispatus]
MNAIEAVALIVIAGLFFFLLYYHLRLLKARKEHKELVKKVQDAKNHRKGS